jgi:hypothetical protein
MQIVIFIIYAPIFEMSLFAIPIIVANWSLRTVFFMPAPYFDDSSLSTSEMIIETSALLFCISPLLLY